MFIYKDYRTITQFDSNQIDSFFIENSFNQYGLMKNLRKKVDFKPAIVISAIVLDVIVLAGFIFTKAKNDLTVVIVSIGIMLLIYVGEKWFLSRQK